MADHFSRDNNPLFGNPLMNYDKKFEKQALSLCSQCSHNSVATDKTVNIFTHWLLFATNVHLDVRAAKLLVIAIIKTADFKCRPTLRSHKSTEKSEQRIRREL